MQLFFYLQLHLYTLNDITQKLIELERDEMIECEQVYALPENC